MKINGKNVLICVTGGIAAYKSIDLASKLVKNKANVKTILTSSALEFIKEINFSAITHDTVHVSMFSDLDPIPHITLAEWADIIVVAPATASAIAKVSHGFSDDLMSATILATKSPIIWVPAMNVHMLENPATQSNIARLKSYGHFVLEPDSGQLACGYHGKGKYPDNEEIMYAIQSYIDNKLDLQGRNVLVTAGACVEMIDPMRCITNLSSGKTAVSIARALHLRGANVTLIHGAIQVSIPYYFSRVIRTNSSNEMYEAVIKEYENMDMIIMCAAVADYTPKSYSNDKLKKQDELILELVRNKDILYELGQKKKSNQILIGFAAETNDLIENAKKKLKLKNLDYIVANDLNVLGMSETTQYIISKNNIHCIQDDKFEAANKLIDYILNDEK